VSATPVVVNVNVFRPLTDPEVALTVSQAGRVVVSTLKNAVGIFVELIVTVEVAGTPEPMV
jgi:hypothetical protein